MSQNKYISINNVDKLLKQIQGKFCVIHLLSADIEQFQRKLETILEP